MKITKEGKNAPNLSKKTVLIQSNTENPLKEYFQAERLKIALNHTQEGKEAMTRSEELYLESSSDIDKSLSHYVMCNV